MLTQKVQIQNLPSQPTPFIGREPEIVEIVGLLQDENCRLLTLLGAGGMGKTRLAIESIQRLITNDFEHGIFYVPLAPLTSPDNIVTTVISVLGIMIRDDGTPQEELVKFLRGRNLLLVMDNFEHVLDGADLVADILNNTPNVKILVTSRESLNLQVEWVWHVKGMRFPDATTIDNIEQYSALKLFLDRAKRMRRDFLPETELNCAIGICQLMDGMPLGIELAASWLKTLSCADIIKEIKQGIDFLTTRSRDIPERHRSIRAVFDQSWNLLTADEQAVFPRLSVFRGGFTRDAAAKVADADLLTLSGLVEKSLVRYDETGRYDLHELLRQYALEKLKAVGKVDDSLLAHTLFFADFLRERAIDIKGRRQVGGLNEIEADFDNSVQAWYHAIDRVDYDALDQIMEGLIIYCEIRRHHDLGKDLFSLAQDQLKHLNIDVVHPVYNRICVRYVRVWTFNSPSIVPEHIQLQVAESFELASLHEDNFTIAYCLWLSGKLLRLSFDVRNNFPTAIERYKQAIAHFQDAYYQRLILNDIAECYRLLGEAFSDQQYIIKSIEYSERYRSLSSDSGDLRGVGDALHQLADAHRVMGHTDLVPYYRDAITIWDKVGDLLGVGYSKLMLGELYFYSGNINDAIPLFNEAQELIANINSPGTHNRIAFHINSASIINGEYETSLDLYLKYERQVRDTNNMESLIQVVAPLGYSASYFGLRQYEKATDYFVKALRFDLTPNVPILYILCYPVSALLLWHMNKIIPATKLVGTIFSYPDHETGWLRQWDLFNQMCADLEAQLGTEDYQTIMKGSTRRELRDVIPELLMYLDEGEESETRKSTSQPLAELLTPREFDVLTLLADGLTNPEIAQKLHIASGTVRVHTRNIYGKLGVNNRTIAVITARNKGII